MVKRQSHFYGLAISPGIGFGKVCIWGPAPVVRKKKISVDQVPLQLDRLAKALTASEKQILELKEKVTSNLGKKEAKIFDAYSLFLNDPGFVAQIEKKIVESRVDVETALIEVIEESIKVYSSVDDVYLKERIQDIRDVGRRILDNLIGFNQQCNVDGDDDIIVIAEEISASQMMHLDHSKIKGFITEKGGETSHTAILARSLGLPMISGVKDLFKKINADIFLLMNGFNGEIIKEPTEDIVSAAHKAFPKLIITDDEIKQLNKLPTRTLDGQDVVLMANIRSQGDLNYAQHFNAEGIGLYRTEMSFLNRQTFPSEEEQYEIYRTVAESIAPYYAIIRTVDLGGDKFSPYFPVLKNREMNPYLGLRAIRISLANPRVFEDQLRAILRASAHGKVKLMLPLISGVEEIKITKRILAALMKQMKIDGVQFDENIEIGAMIEVPSAVIVINSILKEVDFISVGTNDLIQYTLAVDRSNELVSHYYEPLHPSILHSLKTIVDAANQADKDVSICGEMAGDLKYTRLLLGLGYYHLSMSAFFIPQIKKIIRSIHLDEAREMAFRALHESDLRKIKKILEC